MWNVLGSALQAVGRHVVCPELVTWAGLTDPGCVRNKNEDRYCGVGPLGLFAVADGMGGAPEGDVAAKLVLDIVRGAVEQASGAGRTAHLDASRAAARLLRSALLRAHEDLRALGRSEPARKGMGTTFTGMWIVAERTAVIAHVGDSRAYRWRAGELTQLTNDHSIVQEFLRRGLIDEAEATSHWGLHMLSRVIGGQQHLPKGLEVDVLVEGSERGDAYLLMTDGVHDVVSDNDVAAILRREVDPARIVAELIARANAAGGRDNCTAVAVRIGESGE